MNRALYQRALELGVTVLLETPAGRILKEDGRVTGVLAKGPDNEDIEVKCKAAIICTGGAGANKRMIKDLVGLEHGKTYLTLPFRASWGWTSDGLGGGRRPASRAH